MGFIEVFVKKPAIAIAICIIVLIAGITAYMTLPVRQFPVFPPQDITISTTYSGASPQTIQGFVTLPIEEAISTIEGIDYVAGENLQGSSTIKVKLKPNANLTTVLTKINTNLASIMWRLPKDINNPVVETSNASSPSLYLGITTRKGMSLEQATAYTNHSLIPAIRAIPGVQDMRIRGAREYAMRIWLNPEKMAAYHVTPLAVKTALQSEHLQAAVGRILSHSQEYNLALNASLETPTEFNNIIIKNNHNKTIRLKDIGHAAYGPQSTDSSVIVNGKPGILLYIKTKKDANDIKTVHQILTMLPELKKKLPDTLQVNTLWNPTKFSEKSIHEVKKTIWEAIILIIIVTCLFLGEFKSMLIPIVTIPLSLLGTCAILLLIGFTINTMTLLAAVLAIGLVVDDAIVVLENVHRHILNKVEPVKAAIIGTKELLLPIIAMTVVVAIVFIPIGLTSGITGILFHEFAFSLSITVILSGIFSLILSPMMCAKMLKPEHTKLATWINTTFNKLADHYQQGLIFIIKFRYVVVLMMVALFVLCYVFFKIIPSELMPQEKQGVVLGVGDASSTVNSHYVYQTAKKLSQLYKRIPEQTQYGVISGDSPPFNNIVSFLMLKPNADEDKLIKTLGPMLSQIPGMSLFPMNRPLLADVTGLTAPVNFVLQTTGTYAQLNKTMTKLIATARKNPGLINMSSNLHINKPQINIDTNRDLAKSLGISMSDIAGSLNFLYGEPTLGWFDIDGYSYPIIPGAMRALSESPNDINNIELKDANNTLVPLSTFTQLKQSVMPLALHDYEMLHSATLTANLAPGYTLGQALAYLQTTADKVLPGNTRYTYSGESQLYMQSHGEMFYIYLSTLISIYLLLAIKFNSFVDPIIIMVSVPLSILGALFAIHAHGFTLNIYTQIGLIMLIGLISKHGILIVDFANHLQMEKGLAIKAAIIESAKTRLRPILMTTAAMVLGAIPLTFASGAGHESLQQIGWVIVGGLLFGSLLTLFVVPSLYTLLAKNFN